MTSSQRQPRFQRNPELESLLREINERLEPAESDLRARFVRPALPVVLVIGAPRSGTTLMMQWLAATGVFAFPSNLLSRFFAAPYIGARICQLIGDAKYNYGDELLDHSTDARSLQSELGKTRGMFEPNEFWYFWRRFFPIDQAERLESQQLAQVDVAGFLSGLASLQHAFNKPWAMKGILLQYNLAFLDSILDSVLFLHTTRDVTENAQSLLAARVKYFGSESEWFSVRPPGYQKMLAWDPAEQVVGQVHATNASIEAESRSIAPQRYLQVDYRSFCLEPARVYKQVRQKLQEQGQSLPADYSGPLGFQPQSYSNDQLAGSLPAAVEKVTRSNSRDF